MKVGIYVTSLAPAGASQARFQSAIFEGLIRHNNDRHQFIVFSDRVPTGLQDTPLLSFIQLETDGYWKRIADFARRALSRLASRWAGMRHASLVQRLGRTEPAYYKQLKACGVRIIWNLSGHELRSWLPYIKTVWDVNHRIHSMYPEFSYTRFTFDGLDIPLRLSLPKASYLITGTEEGKRQIVSMFGVSEYKVRVIPFPTPPLPPIEAGISARLKFKTDAPYLFYPARLWPHKNHVVIIAALRVLRDRWNIVLNLALTGENEGNLQHVMEYAKSQGVSDQVQYLGKVDDAELARVYRGAFALVYASAVGPDNLPPLEAMSLGCPAIVADVPGAREQYGDACLFFPPTSHEDLAAALKLVASDSSLRQSLIDKGHVRARQWTVGDYAGRIVELLNEFELVSRAWGQNDATFT